MKKSRYKFQIIVVLPVFLSTIVVFGQNNPYENLHKYCKYRERLKNYVVIGDCQGCSNPAESRDGSDILAWNDATIHLGYYIAMLATEHKVLSDHGQSTTATVEELFYALEAFNRLDKTAEYWWRYYYNEEGTNAQQLNTDLNGFFIRTDVPADFFNRVYNNDLIENHLNSGFAPPPDNWEAKIVDSGFEEGIQEIGSDYGPGCNDQEGKHVGPREESLDQVVQLMVGFALVSRFIPPGITFGTFSDGETDFLEEAKNIVERINSNIQGDGWEITNPVTGRCVNGVFWRQHHPTGDPCKCDAGGAKMGPFSYGFARSNCHIQAAPDYTNATTVDNFYSSLYSSDGTVNVTSKFLWNNIFTSSALERFKILTYAAISNVWDDDTDDVLGARCHESSDLHHLPLLHQALYGGSNLFADNAFYECLLNSAPCFGNNRYNSNNEWSGGNRILNGRWDGINSYSDESYGIDYMLYFNLYNIVNPNYITDWVPCNQKDLCHDVIEKQNYIESDVKNFLASDKITAGNLGGGDYTIQNDNDPNQSSLYSAANVNFVAGNEIDLPSGFEVKEGSFFDASIDPTLQQMNCVEPASVICSPSLKTDYASIIAKEGTIKKDSSGYVMGIFPNPNSGLFIITTGVEKIKNKLIIYDVLGNVVYQSFMLNEQLIVDLSTQSPGIYFVKIYDQNEQIEIKKIIIQ